MIDIEIPRVTGRHRNRPLACLRREKAMLMVAQGSSYQQVADALGYANKGTVWRIVQQATREHLAPVAEEFRTSELDRLRALQAALWDQAMAGDVSAAKVCRDTIMACIRLQGLDRDDTPVRPMTVVVPEGFIPE